MKENKSVIKGVASIVAGGALAASLYANAVFVPQNDAALQRELDQQVEAIVKGKAEFQAAADGFRVVERQPASKVATLTEEISKLESELAQTESANDEAEPTLSAYKADEVKRTAQAPRGQNQGNTGGGGLGTLGGLGIAGLRNGALIGQGAGAFANVFVNQNMVQNAPIGRNTAGLLNSQTTVGGGNAGGGNEVVVQTTTGQGNVGGTGTGANNANAGGTVGQAASNNPESSTAPPASP